MRRLGGVVVGAVALSLACPAIAGPWTQPKGKGQVIVKLERMRADRGYDPEGDLVSLPAERLDTTVGMFAEYGLTDRVTLQLKGDWQQGEDAFVDYEGRGPVEIGVTWQAWRSDAFAVSLYGGYADGGEGRNAGYALPGQGERDWEVRASVGRTLAEGWGPVPDNAFFEVQTARRMREGLPDETRVDITAGVHLAANWMLLSQAFGGKADDGGPRWLSMETSVVRQFGDWSVQAGWRQTVAGRETPDSGGPMLALWRRF